MVKKLPTIILNRLQHRGKNNLQLSFEYNDDLIKICKSIKCKWSATHKIWYIENTKENFQLLFDSFKGIAFLDITNLRKKQDKPPSSSQHKLNDIKRKYNELNKLQKEIIKDYSEFLRGRRYSDSSVRVYAGMVTDFVWFTRDKMLQEISNKDVELINQQVILKYRYSISYQRQFVSAIKLFTAFKHLPNMNVDGLVRPKKSKKLPLVLSKEEVISLIRVTKNLKHRTVLTTLYSCGLRVGELLNLKLRHVDIDRKQIWIEQSKGRKDRVVVMSDVYIPLLINYIQTYQPREYLIEGQNGGKYSASSIRQLIRHNCKAAGILKPVTPHTLRHSYATHLLELGTDIRYIQELLGHTRTETTMIYTHVTKKDLLNIKSPLDTIVQQMSLGDNEHKNLLLSRKL